MSDIKNLWERLAERIATDGGVLHYSSFEDVIRTWELKRREVPVTKAKITDESREFSIQKAYDFYALGKR